MKFHDLCQMFWNVFIPSSGKARSSAFFFFFFYSMYYLKKQNYSDQEYSEI